jgi:hypothetical protein
MAEETTEVEQEINEAEVEQDNTTEEDKIDWRAEALKQTAIANRLKKKLSQPIIPKQEPKIDDEIVKDVNYLKQVEAKRQFGFEHNLSPEETDYAFKFSGGKPTKEILEDPFFKGGLDSLRAKKRLEANIPGSSSRSSVFSDKPFTELTPEERKKQFESKMKVFKK